MGYSKARAPTKGQRRRQERAADRVQRVLASRIQQSGQDTIILPLAAIIRALGYTLTYAHPYGQKVTRERVLRRLSILREAGAWSIKTHGPKPKVVDDIGDTSDYGDRVWVTCKPLRPIDDVSRLPVSAALKRRWDAGKNRATISQLIVETVGEIGRGTIGTSAQRKDILAGLQTASARGEWSIRYEDRDTSEGGDFVYVYFEPGDDRAQDAPSRVQGPVEAT